MDSNYDPDVSAAFGGTPTPAAPPMVYDADVAGAFGSDPSRSDTPSKDYPIQMADPETGKIYYTRKPQTDTQPVDAAGVFAKNAFGALGYLPRKIISGYGGLATFVRTGDLDRAANTVGSFAEQQPTLSPSGQWAQNLYNNSLGALPGKIVSKTGDVLEKLGVQPDVAHGLPEAGADIASVFGTAAGIRGSPESAPMGMGEPPAPDLESNLASQYSGQSMGAAGAAPDLADVRPQFRQAVESAAANGPINKTALANHVDAETLPVPAELTAGQATRDPGLWSDEQNMRSSHPELMARFNSQAENLRQNWQTIRDNAGPEVNSTNPVEHGQTVIDAYKQHDAPVLADIDSKYQALRDSNGGQFPVDAPQLLANIKNKLSSELLTGDAPTSQMNALQGLSDSGNMSFEQYLNLRRNLGTVARTSADGNTRTAAGIMINEMENLPLQPAAAGLKPLADAARSAAKARFDALDADPAYKAAVNGTDPPDTFINKYYTGGGKTATVGQAQSTLNTLKDNPIVGQTLSVATLDRLRDASGMGPDLNGALRQSGYNRELNRLGPRAQSLLAPDIYDQASQLGRVAFNQQVEPSGGATNWSRTSVASHAAQMTGRALATTAEAYANTKTLGLGGTVARSAIARMTEKARVNRSLAPGAGLTP